MKAFCSACEEAQLRSRIFRLLSRRLQIETLNLASFSTPAHVAIYGVLARTRHPCSWLTARSSTHITGSTLSQGTDTHGGQHDRSSEGKARDRH